MDLGGRMPFSTWRSDLGKVVPDSCGLLRNLTGLLIGTAVFVLVATRAVSDWQITPEVRVSGGHESDVVIDPELSRIIVPGGSFAELAPAVSVRGWLGPGTFVDLGTFATLQRFLNEESRLLYAHTVQASAFQSLGDSFRGRMSATLDYFDDSERETVRRLATGGELGVAFIQRQWDLELWGGGSNRKYPNLTLQEQHGQTAIYAEGAWSGGTTLRASLGRSIDLRADGILQVTDSRDPLFDSKSWAMRANVDTRIMASLFLTLSGTYQEREFDKRAQGENRDEYWQIGTGLRYAFQPGWTASVRWGYSGYTWPDGAEENSYRLAIGIHHTWGRRGAPPLPSVNVGALTRAGSGSIKKPDPDGKVWFRIRAIDAEQVTVVGSFNAWDSGATPLRPLGDGWWEARVELAPGLYEYAYVIDGVWTTPPEAKITVPDGFGGHNGILEVLPADL